MAVYDKIKELYAAGMIDDDLAQEVADAKRNGATDAELYALAKAGYSAGKMDDSAAEAVKAEFSLLQQPSTAQPDATAAVVEPKQRPLTDFSLDELTTAYQQAREKTGSPVSYAEAEETVTRSPRASYAEVMDSGVLAELGGAGMDILSAPGRLAAGAIRSVGGESGREAAFRVQSPIQAPLFSLKGLAGLAENIMVSPATPMAPVTGAMGIGAAARMLPAASGAARGAAAGLVGSAADMAIEQGDRAVTGREMLSPAEMAIGAGIGTGIGAAAGKISDMVSPKFTAPTTETPTGSVDLQQAATPRAAQKQATQMLEEEVASVPKDVQKAYSKWLPSPRYAVGFVGKDTEKDIPYSELLKLSKGAPFRMDGQTAVMADDALETVVKRTVKPALSSYQKQRREIGKAIGDLREEAKADFWRLEDDAVMDAINKNLEGIKGERIALSIDDNGNRTYSIIDADGDAIARPSAVAKELMAELEGIRGNFNFTKTENLRKSLQEMVPTDPTTRLPVVNQSTNALQEMDQSFKDLIDDRFEEILGKEARTEYKKLRAEYRSRSKYLDRLGRLLGAPVGDLKDPATFTRGSSAVKRVVSSPQDMGSREIWDEIYKKTGYNIPRNAAKAIVAMNEGGDYAGTNLLQEIGMIARGEGKGIRAGWVDKTVGAVKDKAAEIISPSGMESAKAAQVLATAPEKMKLSQMAKPAEADVFGLGLPRSLQWANPKYNAGANLRSLANIGYMEEQQ